MRVVVLGGGYAGLACLIDLRNNLPEVELHLVDPGEAHLIVTHLHQTLARPRADFQRTFATLGERLGFHHHREAIAFGLDDLRGWERRKRIALAEETLPFDYLLVATGARATKLPRGEGVNDLEDFRHTEGRELLAEFIGRGGNSRHLSIVGGGATGIQFLFELHDQLARRGHSCRLRLLNLEERLLPALPPAFHHYLQRRLQAADIDYLPSTCYLGQSGGEIHVKDRRSGKGAALPSDWTLLFPGVLPSPLALEANRYGQVLIEEKPLEHIFTAGDCAHYPARGEPGLTAQAAVHQGKQVATNMRRLAEGRFPLRYFYRERGYFVSLGPRDGIGWLGLKQNVFRGFPALAVKKALSLQYDLFLQGIDTFLNL